MKYNCLSNQEKTKVVSLQPDPKPVEDMACKKKEEKSPEVLLLEARIRELELQNLALNTLIDVAERGAKVKGIFAPCTYNAATFFRSFLMALLIKSLIVVPVAATNAATRE